MKTVMTGSEVPHRFAHDKKAVARNANRTLFCEDGVIYSYRTSAPLAAWHGDMILVNSDKYSVTTSKHQSWLRQAIHHIPQIHAPALRDLLGAVTEKGYSEYIHARHLEIEELKAKRPRAEWSKNQNAAEIAHLESVCAFVWREMAGKRSHWGKAIGAKVSADKAQRKRNCAQYLAGLIDLRDNATDNIRLSGNLEYTQRTFAAAATVVSRGQYAENFKFMGKTFEKQFRSVAAELLVIAESMTPRIRELQAERDAQARMDNAERAAAWIAGGNYPPSGPTLCRVIGEEVQTSRGARVPLRDALMVFELAKTRRPFKTDRACGIYRGIEIDESGNITIGCHYILFTDAADCFARYEESKA